MNGKRSSICLEPAQATDTHFPIFRVLYGVIPSEYSRVYRKHMALGLQLPTRSSLGLSPPSLTGAEAQVAFEAGRMGSSPCSGAL